MRYYFHDAKRMYFIIDTLFANSFVMSSILLHNNEANATHFDSDKGDLVEEINPFEYTG